MKWLDLTDEGEDTDLWMKRTMTGESDGLPVCPYRQDETTQHKCPKFELGDETDYCNHVLFVGKSYGFCEIAREEDVSTYSPSLTLDEVCKDCGKKNMHCNC
jgi:hypothetical protein